MKLIDKDALLAEIERLVNNYDKALDYEAALEDVRNFIDTLEVKEVDLDAEWVKYFENRGDMATVNIKHLAKYFFELGLKVAQKGEK